jgi:hypothetical protein
MSTQNEERNAPAGARTDNADKAVPTAWDEPAVAGSETGAKRKGTKRVRTSTSKKADEEKAQPDQGDAKRTRMSRSTKTKQLEGDEQAEPQPKPKRASVRKSKELADVSSATLSTADVIPPVTQEAIAFLGRENPTSDDVLKLAPASLAFVQHHYKLMARIDAMSEVNYEYLAKAKPASPAVQKFIDAMVKMRRDEKSSAEKQLVAAKESEPIHSTTKNTPEISYSPRHLNISAPIPVVLQLGKIANASINTRAPSQSPNAVLDDQPRAQAVVGTAHIVMAAETNDLTQKEAVELVANDIKAVRAISDPKSLNLALNAMAESSQAQPIYMNELERQAPDLVERIAKAHKELESDWNLANGVSVSLSHVAEIGRSLSRDEATALATDTIAAIQRIQSDQHRQVALSFSHQIGQWQRLYKEEFSRQAPELVMLAQTAFVKEESKVARDGQKSQEGENTIEPSPVQLVSRQPQSRPEVAASVVQTPSPAAPALENLPASPRPVANIGKRVLDVIGRVVQKAGIWIAGQGEAEQVPTKADPVASAQSSATTQITPTPAVTDKSTVVPDFVASRFLRVKDEYYFPDRTPAFSDRGNKLATRGNDAEVVKSLVEIAIARGWTTITVKGTDEFRRSAWMEAAQRGLSVVGYKPSELDFAELASRPAGNTVEKGTPKAKESVPEGPKSAARLGPIEQQTRSKATAPAPETKKLDPALVEKSKDFQEKKPAFVVKKYPDLAAAYGIVEAAKRFASEKLPETAHEEFVGIAQNHVIQKIVAGESIQGPRIYLAPAKTLDVRSEVGSAVREADDLGQRVREKSVAKER